MSTNAPKQPPSAQEPAIQKQKKDPNRILSAKVAGDVHDDSGKVRSYQYFFLLKDENRRGVKGELEFSIHPAKAKYESVTNRVTFSNARFWNDSVPESGSLQAIITVSEDTELVIVVSGWVDEPLELNLDGPKKTKKSEHPFFKNWE